MRILIVEDDFDCRCILQLMLSKYGLCHIAVDGEEAIDAYKKAVANGEPYDLICLDIMMPKMDGRRALQAIREYEKESGVVMEDSVKIVMITALCDPKNIMGSFFDQCEGYLIKPFHAEKLRETLEDLHLII